MRIGVLAPITHQIPPSGYGPWERVAYESVEGFVELGHEVTLFAPEGTESSAKNIETTVRSPLAASNDDPRLAEEFHIARAMEIASGGAFDVLHSHLHVHVLAYRRFLPCPLVSTLHGSAWNQAHHQLLGLHRDANYVSISNAERRFFPELNYVGTVYNGINLADFEYRTDKEGFLLFAGRLAEEKAPDLAIAVARRSGSRLVLAGEVEPRHRAFFDAEVAGHLDEKIEYVGPQSRSALASLLARAKALLMPLRWDEPFGLVVAEALASGTPVIGWKRGALPELIQDGREGFLVSDVEEAVTAVGRVDLIDPAIARSRAERVFSRRAMAEGYLAVFSRLIGPTSGLRSSAV